MLSLHEGFGLTGWEAIGAEVPLILGTNSGLYELIDDLLGGAGTGSVRGPDRQHQSVVRVGCAARAAGAAPATRLGAGASGRSEGLL